MIKEKANWLVIGRGFAGWHAAKVNTSSSGGDLLTYTYWTGEQCPGYAAEAVDGCFVYDAFKCEQDQVSRDMFADLAINGPLLSLKLEPDTSHGFGDPHSVYVDPNLPLPQFGPLDYIGLNIFKRLLSQIPGIRFGTIRNGEVIWEDEANAK